MRLNMRQFEAKYNDLETDITWRASLFNEYLGEIAGNTWVIYNNLSGAMIEISKEVYDSLLNNDINNSINPKFYKPLSYGKFIIDSEDDEIENLKKTKEKLNVETKVLGLQILPTLNCNFLCSYCYEQPENLSEHIYMSKDVMDATIEFVKRKIKPTTEHFNVMWFGGEPLMDINCIQYLSKAFIRIAKEHNVKYEAYIATNGYLLNPKNVDILIDNQVKTYQVTIDGPERIHDQRRMLTNGGKTWRRIIDNLKNISLHPKLNIKIRINIDKTNIGYIRELFDNLKDHDIFSKVYFSFGIVTSHGKVCRSIEDTLLTLEKADERLKNMNLETLLKNSRDNIARPMPDLIGCTATSRNSLIIGPKGELYKCSSTIGTRDETGGTIFNVDEKNPNLKKWLTLDNINSPLCQKCSMLPVCIGTRCPFYILIDKKNNVENCNREKRHSNYHYKLKSLYKAKKTRVKK
jgi:uncharacterized protein